MLVLRGDLGANARQLRKTSRRLLALPHRLQRSIEHRYSDCSRPIVPKFPGAQDFVPAKASLATLRSAAQECRGCDLYAYATQAVLGEGPARARIVLVGEQPGDKEDLAGRPFVGPAGELLN